MSLLKIILVFALFSFACTKNSETANDVKISSSVSQNTNGKLPDENPPLITIEESGGMCNLCAGYELKILSDRTAIFEGNYFAEKEKTVKGKIGFTKEKKNSERKLTEEEFENLLKKFEDVKFFNLADRYIPASNCPENWTDSSTIHISFAKNENTKTIHYYRGCKGSEELKKLADLENFIDKMFDTEKWLSKSTMVNSEILDEPIEQLTK